MVAISALMPVYNTNEKYFRDAIDSVLNQTFSDLELIIVDDGSKPYVEDIVKTYNDKRIAYYKNEKNSGLLYTRNRLLTLAKGKYVAMADSDDINFLTRFAEQFEFMENNPEVGVLGTYMERFPKYKLMKYPTDSEEIQMKLLFSSFVIGNPSAMIRREVLDKTGAKYKYPIAEDYGLWCDLAGKTKFANLPQTLVKYRVHGSNISKSKKALAHEIAFRIRADMKVNNPLLWQYAQTRIERVTKVKLFEFIPFITSKKTFEKTTVYLFGFIPLYDYKSKDKYKG